MSQGGLIEDVHGVNGTRVTRGCDVATLGKLSDKGRIAVVADEIKNVIEPQLTLASIQKGLLPGQRFESANVVGLTRVPMVLTLLSEGDTVHGGLENLV